MTEEQKNSLIQLLVTVAWRSTVIHHGGCIGADAEFDDMARKLHYFDHAVVHPCILVDKWAFIPTTDNDYILTVKPPLVRNQDIVEDSDVVIATPKEDHETLRSGTWATIRYARKAGKPLCIILPNGATFTENRFPVF